MKTVYSDKNLSHAKPVYENDSIWKKHQPTFHFFVTLHSSTCSTSNLQYICHLIQPWSLIWIQTFLEHELQAISSGSDTCWWAEISMCIVTKIPTINDTIIISVQLVHVYLKPKIMQPAKFHINICHLSHLKTF